MEADRLVFGITLDQVDALDRLIRTIAACGDVIAVAGDIELDGRTLPVLGQAALEAANAARSILDTIEEQRLDEESPRRQDVGESRGRYGPRLVAVPAGVRH